MGSVHGTRPGAALAAAGLAVGCLLVGCAPAPPPPPAPATYPLAPRPVRKGEVPLNPAPVTDDNTVFELIGLSTGMYSVIGSHAEWPAKGRFARVRVVITNTGRETLSFDTGRQLLRTADGAEHAPDSQAMLIKRQPGKFDLGPTDRLEFDLYYDVPPDAVPTALRAFGGPSLAEAVDTTGVDVPITPAP